MIVVMFAAIIVLLATVFFTGGKANAQGSAFWESFQDEQSRLDRNDWRRAQERERQAGVDLARRLHNGGGPMYGSPNYGFAPPPQYGGYGNYGYNFAPPRRHRGFFSGPTQGVVVGFGRDTFVGVEFGQPACAPPPPGWYRPQGMVIGGRRCR